MPIQLILYNPSIKHAILGDRGIIRALFNYLVYIFNYALRKKSYTLYFKNFSYILLIPTLLFNKVTSISNSFKIKF